MFSEEERVATPPWRGKGDPGDPEVSLSGRSPWSPALPIVVASLQA